MSNRLLALIILGVIVLGIIGMYVYLFVFYSSSLNFSSNQAGYNIQLVAKKLKTPVNYSCKQKECSYDDIAPLDYQVIISKEGFEDYQGNISVKRSSEQNIVFELEKKTELSTIEEEVVSLKDAVREKRTRLKYKKFYTYYDFGDSGVFYFRKYLGKLFLYRDLGEKEQLIYDFQMLDVSDLHIGEVYNSSYFVISAGTKNYLFNHKNSNFSSLDIQKKIHYGKKSHETNKLLLVTDLGAFEYDLKSRKSQYSFLFHDYISISSDTYVALFTPEDSKRRDNAGLPASKMYELYWYELSSGKYKKILSSKEQISQFYIEDEEMYIRISRKWKILKNYKK